MSARIALQLYSVRQALAQDFAGVVKKIADMGYVGVETAGFPGTTPLAAGQLLKDLGLLVVAAHAPLPLGEKKQEVIETMQAIHCPRIVCASRPAEGFATPDGIQQVCETLNEAHAVARASGLAFGYHNHTAEFQMVGERNAFDIFVERLDPGIFLEVDTYWVQAAGINPATVVQAYRELEVEGFVEMRQGAGTFVRELPEKRRGEERTHQAVALARRVLAEAGRLRIPPQELRDAIVRIIDMGAA